MALSIKAFVKARTDPNPNLCNPAELKAAFAALDPDGAGSIPLTAVAGALRAYDLSDIEAEQLLLSLREVADEDGRVGFAAWLAAMLDWRKARLPMLSSHRLCYCIS